MFALRRSSLELSILGGAGLILTMAAGPNSVDLLRCARALPCLLNMAALAESLPGAREVCPVTGAPYGRSADGFVSCGDSGRHLGLPLSLGAGARLGGDRPPPLDPALGPRPIEVPGGLQRAVVDVRRDQIVVTAERGPRVKRFLGPMSIAAGLLLFILGAARGPADRARLGPTLASTRNPYRRGALLKEGIISVLASVGLMAAGGFAFAWGVDAAAGSRRAIFMRDGRAEFQEFYLGRAWTSPDLVPRLTGVLPAPAARGKRRLYALYPKDGAIRQRYIATIMDRDLALAEALNPAPRP